MVVMVVGVVGVSVWGVTAMSRLLTVPGLVSIEVVRVSS
jgi:hypothetical protein